MSNPVRTAPKHNLGGDGSESPSSSPTKKQKTFGAPKTPKTPGSGKGAGSDNHDRSQTKRNPSNPIPMTWEEASVTDQMIYNLKKNGAKNTEIQAAYKYVHGTAIASSTISKRVARLMANFDHMKPDDLPYLVAAINKDNIERYTRLTRLMKKLGSSQTYSVPLIHKTVGQLEAGQLTDSNSKDAGIKTEIQDEPVLVNQEEEAEDEEASEEEVPEEEVSEED